MALSMSYLKDLQVTAIESQQQFFPQVQTENQLIQKPSKMLI